MVAAALPRVKITPAPRDRSVLVGHATLRGMDIELNQPASATLPDAGGPPRLTWRALAAVVLAGVVAAAGISVAVAHNAAADAAHSIAFEWAGAGQTDYAAVWPRGGHPVTPTSILTARELGDALPAGDRYADPMAALLVVRAEPGGRVECRIVVDGTVVDRQSAVDGLATTCAWRAG